MPTEGDLKRIVILSLTGDRTIVMFDIELLVEGNWQLDKVVQSSSSRRNVTAKFKDPMVGCCWGQLSKVLTRVIDLPSSIVAQRVDIYCGDQHRYFHCR